jgi:hypothetical protein
MENSKQDILYTVFRYSQLSAFCTVNSRRMEAAARPMPEKSNICVLGGETSNSVGIHSQIQ